MNNPHAPATADNHRRSCSQTRVDFAHDPVIGPLLTGIRQIVHGPVLQAWFGNPRRDAAEAL
jgi:hypothetical protein